MSKHNQQQSSNTQTSAAVVFGPVEFSRPASVRKLEKYGRVSCLAIAARVPLMGSGLAIDAAIWGERKETPDGVEIVFGASLPKNVIPFGDDDGRERFLSHVEHSAMKWAGYEKATDYALEVLTGVRSKDSKAVERPRLVKTAGKTAEAAKTA